VSQDGTDASLWAGLAALATAVLAGLALLIQKLSNALTLRAKAFQAAAELERDQARGEGGLLARVERLEHEQDKMRKDLHDARDWISGERARRELERRKR
jgi:hypothetical protein